MMENQTKPEQHNHNKPHQTSKPTKTTKKQEEAKEVIYLEMEDRGRGSSTSSLKGHLFGKMGSFPVKLSFCLVDFSGKEDQPQDQAANIGTKNVLNDEPSCK